MRIDNVECGAGWVLTQTGQDVNYHFALGQVESFHFDIGGGRIEVRFKSGRCQTFTEEGGGFEVINSLYSALATMWGASFIPPNDHKAEDEGDWEKYAFQEADLIYPPEPWEPQD